MAFIELIGDEADSEEARRLLDSDRDAAGDVPNFTRLFAHRPEVYEAWRTLKSAVADRMDLRRYELATLAAACELRSTYCTPRTDRSWPIGSSTPRRCAGWSRTTAPPVSTRST